MTQLAHPHASVEKEPAVTEDPFSHHESAQRDAELTEAPARSATAVLTEVTARPPAGPLVEPPAELLDAMGELVVFADGPAERSSVVAALVVELAALVSWSQDAGGVDAGEIAGMVRVVAAAEAHRAQMQARHVQHERHSSDWRRQRQVDLGSSPTTMGP